MTFHVSSISPWQEAFKSEYLQELRGDFTEVDPRHGYIQSAFSSHIVKDSEHNMATQRVSHDTETTKDFRCVIDERNSLSEPLLAAIAALSKLHYPVTMIFMQEGNVSVAYQEREEKVPRLSQEVYFMRHCDVNIITPYGGYPVFHAGNNGINSLYHGRPDRLFRSISSSTFYHRGVIDQIENLRLDIRVCRAAIDPQLSLSCFSELCIEEQVTNETRGDISFAHRSMEAARGIRERISLELSTPLKTAIRGIPDLLLTKKFFYPAFAKIQAIIQPITKTDRFRNSIVHELLERDNLISLPTFVLGGRTKYHSKEATVAGFIKEMYHQTLAAIQHEVSNLDIDTLAIRDATAVENIGQGVNALMAFFVPTMPSVMQEMVSLAWDYRKTNEAGTTILNLGQNCNPGYLLDISTSYGRTKTEDVSGWAPADIRKAQLPSYLVPKPRTILTDEETTAIFRIMCNHYPHEAIATTWDSYQSRMKEVDIIKSKLDFAYAKTIIYEEFNSLADQATRDRRWIIRTSRIWTTLITHISHKEAAINDDDTLSEHEDDDIDPQHTLGSNKLRWYPTASAFVSYIRETWVDRPGSQTSIYEDEPLPLIRKK